MKCSIIYLFSSRKVLFLSFLLLNSSNSYGQSLSAEQIYKKVSGAVVVVHAYNDNDELAAQGSGVVLNDKGYVVTNYHVLSGNSKLKILHGKELVPYVDIIGIDVEKDILILKIEAKKFLSIKTGDSKSLNIGQRVYAIGSPMGLENSISEGIISGLRSVDELKRNFIQITASISPGSSGGAVVNNKGELIGISTLTAKEGQNLNFAIPIDDVLKVKIGSYCKNNEYKDFDFFKKGLDANEKGDYPEAIKYYSLFLEKYPIDAVTYFNRANAKYKLLDASEAIQDYNKAIEINPNLPDVYNNRGLAKVALTDMRGAVQDYNKAIEINPNFTAAYNNRGNAKKKLSDYHGAIQDYNKAIDINPNFADAYNNRGNAKDELKDYSEAIIDYNKAIEINPKDAKAYINRGSTKGRLTDYRGAIQDFTKAIVINPNYALAYYNRGIAKDELADPSGSIYDYSKAIEINPNYADAYYNRGNIKLKLTDYNGAIQDYDRTIAINHDYVDAYNNRGIAKMFLKDKNGACLDWSKAGELGDSKAYDLIKKYCQ